MTFKEFFLEQRKSGPHHHSIKHLVGGHIATEGPITSIANVHSKKKDPKLKAVKNGGIRKINPHDYGIHDLNDPRLTTTGLVPNGKNPNVVIIKNKFGFFLKNK